MPPQFFLLHHTTTILICLGAFLSSSPSWASDNVTEEEALCGKRPDPKDEPRLRQEASLLSQLLPPVLSQNSAHWCSAFAALPLLEHHRFLETLGTTPLSPGEKIARAKAFYANGANRISPFEAIYGHNLHAQRSELSPLLPPEIIKLEKGVSIEGVLFGIQKLGHRVRSTQQLSFSSLDDLENQLQGSFASRLERFSLEALLTCQAPASEVGIDENLRDFYMLYKKLTAAGQLSSTTQMKAYPEVAALLSQGKTPDLTIPPHTVGHLATHDSTHFLSTLRSQLSNLRPLGIQLCAANPAFKSVASVNDDPTDSCRPHAVSVVGAYYRNGQCVVKIRNSWGPEWPHENTGDIPSDGHREVSVKDLLAMQKEFRAKSWPAGPTYYASWVKAAPAPKEKPFIDVDSIFLGRLEGTGTIHSDGKLEIEQGVLTSPNGEISVHENGKKVYP